MTTSIPRGGSSWRVVASDPASDFSRPGQIVEGVRVTFTTQTGVTDSVFVPNDRYGDLDYIRSLIAAKAAQHDGVLGLSG